MAQAPHTALHRRRAFAVMARVCTLAIASATLCSCALLVPPSWRADAPVPLHGPLEVPSQTREESAAMSDAELEAALDEDQARLIVIISQPGETLAGEAQTDETQTTETQTDEARTDELRDIADRLPGRQNEARSRRADDPNETIRHPVIR